MQTNSPPKLDTSKSLFSPPFCHVLTKTTQTKCMHVMCENNERYECKTAR